MKVGKKYQIRSGDKILVGELLGIADDPEVPKYMFKLVGVGYVYVNDDEIIKRVWWWNGNY